MRMGEPDKPAHGNELPPRVDAMGKPKRAARASRVGHLSADLLSTYFGPEMVSRARDELERYTGELVEYDNSLRAYNTAEIGRDGSVHATSHDATIATPPLPPLYHSHYCISQLEELISEVSTHFQGNNGGWKVQTRAARFERRMAERYGIFHPFLKQHPELDVYVRSMQRKFAQGDFSPFRQTKSPIPKSTAVIVLFLMQRGNVGWQVLLLSTLFLLVGLQPWALVVLVAGFYRILENQKNKPRSPMSNYIPTVEPYYHDQNSSNDYVDQTDQTRIVHPRTKTEALLQPVGKPLPAEEEINGSDYDTLLLGHGPATLYAGALLSRAGRRVLVISPRHDASGCYQIQGAAPSVMKKFANVPFDVDSSNIAKVSLQQRLLAPAISTSTDTQGGIRFSKIGSQLDGYAFELLSVPGLGEADSETGNIIALRADGIHSLMENAALLLADGWPGVNGAIGDSTTGFYAATCETINASANQFYLSKLLPDSINDVRTASTYAESSIRHASALLDKSFPVNPHTRSLMAAIGMKEENIKPSLTSMGAHVTNICEALSGEGMHYPIGGPRALCHALANVIEQSGGRIITGTPVASLVFEEDTTAGTTTNDSGEEQVPPRCIGVRLMDNRTISADSSKWHTHSPAIISMHGFITTFIRLLPEEIRAKYKVPRGLPALSEQRPVFKVLFALDGSAEDLELSGADFYRVPGAARAQDEIDPNTGEVKIGETGWVEEDIGQGKEVVVSEINTDPEKVTVESEKSVANKVNKRQRTKFQTGVSWMKISFPSAKDPSFKARHGCVSTCVVTIEADDDFVTPFDTKPKLYSTRPAGDSQRLLERVRKDLVEHYPQLEGNILHTQLIGPLHRGLSHNPERYAAKGIRPDTPYPGLFLGGADLAVESFNGTMVGGWLAANAVVGYSWLDYLYLEKNITSDIARFLEPPTLGDSEDIAVPCSVGKEVSETQEDVGLEQS